WEVAGALRDALWDIEDAVNGVELAVEALAIAEDIERIVARRHALGDLPLEDLLLAESTVLERRAELIERRAALVDAEVAYELLTGLRARPPALVETPVESRDFSAHPLLTLARSEAERARAAVELAARAGKASPTPANGPRRQRDALPGVSTRSRGVAAGATVG